MDPRVKLGHMDCIVEGVSEPNNKDTNMTNDNEEVTFLYRLCDGSSPRSYGINVARLAKLPDIVIALAMKQSKEFEERMTSDSGCKSSHRNIVSAFFERLVSVVDGYINVTQKEFIYITHQLWLRYSNQNTAI
jgi:DNA mismatch repair ATPase MutS